jgi:hypothetical protein
MIKCPFPWFGGKARVADLVWSRLGDVANYVEPFFGGGAVLLNRPHAPRIETINDLDCMVGNFWRAVRANPIAVARYADNPVNEADQNARNLWISSQEAFRERMHTDPEYFDARIAGWWVWGQSVWIGHGWCEHKLPEWGAGPRRRLTRQLPHHTGIGQGIHRQLPYHQGQGQGQGIHRKLPQHGDGGRGGVARTGELPGFEPYTRMPNDFTSGTASRAYLVSYMLELAERLRLVRVYCGDWERACRLATLTRNGLSGLFLDPPYIRGTRSKVHTVDVGDTVALAVRDKAIEWGADPLCRVALCGYEGDYEMPRGWAAVRWKANGGYGNQGNGAAKERAKQEIVWFSPNCLKGDSL